MNKMKMFMELREKYPEFHYRNYEIIDNGAEFVLRYEFEIAGLAKFRPEIRIAKKRMPFRSVETSIVQNLAFQIGLVELVSYWKATCAPKIIVECGFLDAEQVNWWKKLYFYGLGELFYTNNIDIRLDDFVTIETYGSENKLQSDTEKRAGYLVLIGGGKDSVVTLETLGVDVKRDYTMIVNPKPVTYECAKLAGFNDQHIVEVCRKIDKNLLELNAQGLINGHTPFSALLAFVSYFVAELLGLEYTVASNESSANETNVLGRKVNHQYSKSFEFEEDFRNYTEKYLRGGVEYFSFLRPLNELQIAKIFSKLTRYHSVFKSCNIGSKGDEWVWCGKCAKCLFAFIILAPFLYRDRLVEIFGHDLFDDESLLKLFLELTGHGEIKPFDCVGTFTEVNFAISLVVQDLQLHGMSLPFLLDYYAKNFELLDTDKMNLLSEFDDKNNLNAEQIKLLKEALSI